MTVTTKFKEAFQLFAKAFDAKDGYIIDEGETEGSETLYETQGTVALEPKFSNNFSKENNVAIHPSYKGYEVKLAEPHSYDESISIVKDLKEKKTVIVNLHLLDREQATRIVDFLCGATHALNGNQQKIADNVFIFTPLNVALSAETQKTKLVKDAIWNQA